MREQGEIVELKGKIARVKVVRGEKCEGCTVCSTYGEGSMRMEALNSIDAKVGDFVEVKVNPKMVVGHSLLIFVLPVLFLIAGYFFGQSASWVGGLDPEPRGILGALIFFVFSFFPIKLYDVRLTRAKKIAAEVVGYSRRPTVGQQTVI